jgi:hypothetical protein
MIVQREKLWTKFLILGVFIGIVAVTAEVDWAAEHVEVGLVFRYFWLIILLSLGLILPILFMYLAGNKEFEKKESDKKWFTIALIIFVFANGIPPVFYLVLGQTPGFLLYLQLALFGLVPAFIFQPKAIRLRYSILVVLFVIIILPLGILVNLVINELWINPMMDKTLYYLLFWGLLSVFLYFLIAIGWKFGGGTKRQSWNIFISGMLLQYSTLEDFFYFLLNGAPLPNSWPWMSNFVIDLKALFGHTPLTPDLILFCIITLIISIFILFDIHGLIWDKIKRRE